jgi:hypothetical protein
VREKVFLKNTCKENTWVLGVDSPWDGKNKNYSLLLQKRFFRNASIFFAEVSLSKTTSKNGFLGALKINFIS